MALDQEQVKELKGYYPKLSLVEDGGVEFILISPFLLPPGCDPASVDGLLCPTPWDGYTSRLFLSVKVLHKGPGQNWNANGVMIAGRQWWAVSWKTNQEKLTLLGMVLAHLRAFK
jgi:hypothetical protein